MTFLRRISRGLVAIAALALALPAHTLSAQNAEVRGVVRDSATGQPVGGAVVMALDAVGTTLARTITSERGQYRLNRPPGTLLVRAVRLGFRQTTERLPLLNADVMTVDLTLATLPRTLQAVEVNAAQGCPARTDRAEAYALLDQARAGLLATVVARERQPPRLLVVRYERYLDLDGIEIEKQVVRLDSTRNARTSFNAVQSAIDFVDRGFRAGVPGSYTFYGPDADVLLDERFQRGYCFTLAAADTARQAQVGLRFTPASRRDGRIDIDGTLWIDTTGRSLNEIVFRYIGVEALAEAFNAGGRIGFRTLTNGVPFIDQWSMRLVGAPDTMITDAGRSSQVYAVREVGGELARATWPDSQVWNGPQGTISVTAVNRAGEPARGAVLNLVGTDYRVTTDTNGRATIQHVLPGPYAFVVDDPALAPIGLQIPTTRTLTARRSSSSLVRVEVPTAIEHVGRICDKPGAPAPKESWLLARVIDSNGRPATGARWRLSVADGARWRVVSDNGVTGSNGVIALCRSIERLTSVEVAAWRDTRDAVRVQRIVEEPLLVVRVPLPTSATVASTAGRQPTASGPAFVVSGSVTDSTTGAVVPDARVTFLGTPFEGATDSSGTFTVGGLTRGDYTVEVSTPWLDSIGAVARSAVSLTDKSPPLSLHIPSLADVLSAACGSANVAGFVTGRVRAGTAATVPEGLRVVAEWADHSRDSATSGNAPQVSRVAWVESPVSEHGAYRLCGVPPGTQVALRTESDSGTALGSAPLTLQVHDVRRFVRADLVVDTAIVAVATFSGTVIADTSGVPIENAEVAIPDIGRSVLTNQRGAFRVSGIPVGVHLVTVKRVGFAPMMASIDFGVNRSVDQRVLLNPASNTLATVEVNAEGVPTVFEERRKTGIGRFMGRAELDKAGGRRLGDVIQQVGGFGSFFGGAGHAYVVGKRAPSHLLPNMSSAPAPGEKSMGCGGAGQGPCTFNMDDLRNQGYYCPTSAAERYYGVTSCACFAQVYVDDHLMNSSRPTEPFDANTLDVTEIAGVEFYATAASTPGRYSNPNAVCGVLLVWTRRR